MSAIKGDFIGFSFGGQHCSNFNIVRVSDGSRYNENLLPSYQDTIQPRVGADGSYYWNGFYTQKTFSISFAFDSMTEQDFRGMRQWLGQKGLFPLIFDEAPYKQWMARAQDPQLNFICFDGKDENGDMARIYKGEGSVQFIAPYPFATGVVKSQEEVYVITKNAGQTIKTPKPEFPNANEWIGSVELPESIPTFTQEDTDVPPSITLKNCGDLPMDFILKFIPNSKDTDVEIKLGNLSLKIPCDEIIEYEVNTATHLIYKVNDNTKTLINQNKVTGSFFKIPPQEETQKLEVRGAGFSTIPNVDTGEIETTPSIEYSYLFY